jgi:murein DD-endopeptidase MepM/ murein hydrolase activator NlpD
MPRPMVPSRPRAWSRVAVLALVGVAVAGCENSARFDSNPFASNRAPRPEYTGSVAHHAGRARSVQAQPLPAPSRPRTVAARRNGVAYGDRGFAAYRPASRSADVTGSVPAHRAPPPKPSGHWTWDGGRPVTVARGETISSIARRNSVPVSAILQANGMRRGAVLRPGQRLVIPRYVSNVARNGRAAPRRPAPAYRAGSLHVVEPGESLIGIARRSGVSLSALARANNISPYTRLKIGDRVTVPGGHRLSARRAPAPKVAEPRTVPVRERVAASAPVQHARIAKAEVRETKSLPKQPVKQAEAAGSIPSFRWPVRGRIIAGFGARANGTQNDGINLAVPEGTPIKAADDGVVAYAGNELKGYGNLVLIRHSDGYVSAYANASQLLVKRGERVRRGQVIARAGQTGNVTSPQLHFEIRKGSTPVDPRKYLSGA